MITPKEANRYRTILRRHGLGYKTYVIGGERLYLILATRPLWAPEVDYVGRWYDDFTLQGLVSDFEEADAIQRYEQQAEREEAKKRIFYW